MLIHIQYNSSSQREVHKLQSMPIRLRIVTFRRHARQTNTLRKRVTKKIMADLHVGSFYCLMGVYSVAKYDMSEMMKWDN